MNIYVARQPIFDCGGRVYGYEFLYRDGGKNEFRLGTDGSAATRTLLSHLITEFGLDTLTGGAYAFVNFTGDMLEGGYPFLLSPDDFVIEILEDVRRNEALARQLGLMKERGFQLALDDYTGAVESRELLPFADIVKVDFQLTTRWEQAEIARSCGAAKRLLAEKVETAEELELARRLGYRLFQGYYFERPTLLSKKAAEIARTSYVRMWKEIQKPCPSFDTLAAIIREDVTLSYKLLLRSNTVLYYRGHRVTSVKQALVRMGMAEIRRWTLSILMRDVLGQDGDEPAKRSLVRAVFAEGLARGAGRADLAEDAYCAGLFSIIDAIMESDMPTLLKTLSITDEVKRALEGGDGLLGDLLRCVVAYEQGEWDRAERFFGWYGVAKDEVPHLYWEAVRYAENVFDGDRPPVRTGKPDGAARV